MENLQRRASGLYFVRLAVPSRLRVMVGRRELIRSTGTQHLSIAKLVAATILAQWRRRFFDIEQLTLKHPQMDAASLIRIADGDPRLMEPGYLPLEQVSVVLGVSSQELLRYVVQRQFDVGYRFASELGFIVRRDSLQIDDPELGTQIVPSPTGMPDSAQRHSAVGIHCLETQSHAAVVTALMRDGIAIEHWFELDPPSPTYGFIPDKAVELTISTVEIRTRDAETLRRNLALHIAPEKLESARAERAASMNSRSLGRTLKVDRLFSEALEAYAKNFLPQHITSNKEIERIRSGIGLFIEFEGDMALSLVSADSLRDFRDQRLATALAGENKVRLKYKTKSMTASIAAIAGLDWPIMSAAERNLRMQWIGRMFRWLKDQKWIDDNPATALFGESVENKAERRATAIGKKPREPFTDAELVLIFSAPWFKTGKGELTKAGTYREFSPFRYWLPLLGLHLGGRLNELCQLRLDDVRRTDVGTWYVDINEDTQDKSLKRQSGTSVCWSKRKVPLHHLLIELGFVEWCNYLRLEGYVRVFPELSWNETSHYAKEPSRAMSTFFMSLGMPRDNTKVFHSFRHNFNNAVSKLDCSPEMRKRLVGHEPGPGVNERHYLKDPTPDESLRVVLALNYTIPKITKFDFQEGLKAVKDALRRKNGYKGAKETLGGKAKPYVGD